MRLIDPSDSLVDLTIAALVSALLLLSLLSASFVIHFLLRSRRRRRLQHLNSLWPVRLLLVLFSSLWSFSELLRLPLLLRLLPSSSPLLPFCHVYLLSSHAFSEPCFFATLLFLLRSSTHPKPTSSVYALAAALLSSLPFLLLHALFLSLAPDSLAVPSSPSTLRCAYPLYGTVLLALLGAVYVPLFVSACWSAVSVVINKRLRVRLYALAAAVVVALSVQVAALALSALWNPADAVFQGLALAAFLAVFFCAAVGEGILVIRPIVDALAVGETEPGSCRAAEDRHVCIVRVGDDVGGREGVVGVEPTRG